MAFTPVTQDVGSDMSPLYLGPVVSLAILALGLCIARVYTRVTRVKVLYIDDWLIIVGTFLSTVNVLLGCTAVGYGWGHTITTFTPEKRTIVLKLQFAVQTTWIFTLALVRCSVGCSLLRFGQEKWWRAVLYGLIGLQCCMSASWVIIQFGQCKPISYNWEMVADIQCWNLNAIIDWGWASSAIYVTMDLILALFPTKFIRSLTRSPSEKILISCLMALGLLATIICGLKMTTFGSFGKGDPMQGTIRPSMYAKIEEQIGIIASCLPALKGPVESLLKKYGILNEHMLTRPSFVDTVPMGSLPKEHDQRSSGEISAPHLDKDDIRIDSVSVKPGSASSEPHLEKTTSRKEGWHMA
ncbi:hypothetical protein P154DRAFT_222962 [Amniculicola lignicola CBS 123094]|uniref:Rhodopsin domain-containing protein n=1 Tax=Amniculicola lignicola CBS 123094 TaxID=1392246 RepID=A0A6A5WZU4_9PLEO|nr:hypothetical protein P154DRAFT_222962 [Amniculicola lignicola CBS 123094]